MNPFINGQELALPLSNSDVRDESVRSRSSLDRNGVNLNATSEHLQPMTLAEDLINPSGSRQELSLSFSNSNARAESAQSMLSSDQNNVHLNLTSGRLQTMTLTEEQVRQREVLYLSLRAQPTVSW